MLNSVWACAQAWEDGGYSDDMSLAAKCNQHGLRIYCPNNAVCMQRLEPHVSFSRYWNYLRRCASASAIKLW